MLSRSRVPLSILLGRLGDGVSVRTLSDDGRSVPAGEVGEIVLGRPRLSPYRLDYSSPQWRWSHALCRSAMTS